MITRRECLGSTAAIAATAALVPLGILPRPVDAQEARGTPILRSIPASGEALPVIGLGTNNYSPTSFEERITRRVVLERLPQLGGKVVDTAPAYRDSEVTLGAMMAELGNRERLFLATKVTAPGGSVDAGRAMIEESFRRLQTARIDLLQVHNLDGVDVLMPELQSLKRVGRVRYIGVTTSRAEQYPALLAAMRRHPLDFVQVDYSLANRGAAAQVLPLARQRRQAVLVNLPFGGRRDANLFARVRERALPDWAAQFGADSWAQFFLKYVIGHPAVTAVIPGMTRLVNLQDNIGAGFGALPDEAQRRRMEEHWDREVAPA
ncbi:MAG: aldo/keto reductase [Steroidobacteraceae bacterium]|jgi:aryl-alcohol dehydrogenase-like predicted oxidoreductase|nr:aldo/keto reductase [Steroidobacteraceae bacterium]